ncbi:MAG: hypothetical protein Q7U57_00780 [Methylovulum sp.]|nr:hypothetical protein [Methylovulum sp.]
MKKISLKPVLAMVSLLAVLGQANVAVAHDQSGSLGNANSAIDQYQVHCFDDGSGANDHLEVAVKDLAPKATPKVSLQVIRDDTATNTTDAVDGDASYSPEVSVKGSADQYYLMTVDKTAAGAENYLIEYHCITGDNQHTGTDIFSLTNQ